MIHVNFWEKYPDLYRGLEMVESRLRQEARSRNATIESILFRLVSAGGKRLRPALVLLCGGYGGVDQKACAAGRCCGDGPHGHAGTR